MFAPRTSPVQVGTPPYNWGSETVYQCTWYAYYRAMEVGFTAPTWWDRATHTGSYTNAVDWLVEYRDPWQPITSKDYIPVAGDIAVYDYNEFGHVVFLETNTMTSEYRSGDPDSFRNAKLGDFKGVLLGFLHYPYESVLPVERNVNVNQIETTDEQLRIRVAPSLDAEIVGHVQLGYYNVLQQTEADGYTWYEIAKDRWCANITTNYLPSDSADIIKELERYFDAMKSTIKTLTSERDQYKDIVKEVHKITDVGD